VEQLGGLVEAVRSGAIQAEVARQAYRFEQQLASGEIKKVAVNCYVGDGVAEAHRPGGGGGTLPGFPSNQIAGGTLPGFPFNQIAGGTPPGFPSDQIELYAFDQRVADAQLAKLGRVRRERDHGAVDRALRRLSDEARGTTNLMPAIVEAVKAYATLGEIAAAMREVFGEHKEPVKF